MELSGRSTQCHELEFLEGGAGGGGGVGGGGWGGGGGHFALNASVRASEKTLIPMVWLFFSQIRAEQQSAEIDRLKLAHLELRSVPRRLCRSPHYPDKKSTARTESQTCHRGMQHCLRSDWLTAPWLITGAGRLLQASERSASFREPHTLGERPAPDQVCHQAHVLALRQNHASGSGDAGWRIPCTSQFITECTLKP